ncbi:MAG: hypothetical protein Q7I92_11710 [Humidesulfovibrio sp.]|nr:hypothetical protein [Humidesulfovibrio sp.]
MTRAQFISDMESKLYEFDKKLIQLEARPKPKDEKARLAYEETYHTLRKHQDTLHSQLRQAANTSNDKWQGFKNSLQSVYDDVVRHMDELGHKIDGPEDAGVY